MTRNEFLSSLPQTYEQGTQFSYNSGNTQVLAWLTEELYDKTFNDILSEKLWQPMGMDGTAVMTADRVGDVIASHGLFTLAYDLARFGELLRNGGRTPEGHRVLPRSWVRAMTAMTDVSDGQYGYQTWASTAGEGAFEASGFPGQKITVVPEQCLSGVRLSHALGGRIRNGEATDPDAYAFSIEVFNEEWQTMLRAVSEAVGCRATTGTGEAGGGGGGGESAGGAREGGVGGSAPTLPATGGGASLLGVLCMGAAARLWRRRS